MDDRENVCDNCGKPCGALYALCSECRAKAKAEHAAKGPFVHTMLSLDGRWMFSQWNNAEDGKKDVMKAFDETVATNAYSMCQVWQGPKIYTDPDFDLRSCTMVASWSKEKCI